MEKKKADDIIEATTAAAQKVMSLPEAGRMGDNGCYILPAEWNNPEDNIYDKTDW